jgi:hypothetical protein
MADTTTTPKKAPHSANNLVVLILVVLVGLAFVGGWYLAQHKTDKNSTNSSYTTYKNTENGFQLEYPNEWGAPTFSTTEMSGVKHYIIRFNKPANDKLNYSIVLWMDKSDKKNEKCSNNHCYQPNAVTSDNIKSVLTENKSSTAISDATSYATVAGVKENKTSTLTGAQIVSLQKAGVSAATLTYQITGGAVGCPEKNKFSTDSSGSCVEQKDYDMVNKVLKSIKNL